MKKLQNPPPQLIDLPFNPLYKKIAEPFFLSKCHFHIGTGSGPEALARGFGKPILYTNSVFRGHHAYIGKNDFYLLKKLYDNNIGRFLNYEEIITSPRIIDADYHSFTKNNIQIVHNSPDEILMVAKEMIDRLNNKIINPDRKLQYLICLQSIQEKARLNSSNVFPGISYVPLYNIANEERFPFSVEYINKNQWFLGL